MPNLRGVIQNALGRKKVPHHQAGSARDLALQLGMTVPISIRGLVVTLDQLPPATVTFNSGTLGPSTTTGFAQVGLQSDGRSSFRVRVRESGLIGHNYFFAMALLDVVDSQGNMVVYTLQGEVHGTLDIGDSDDDKQEDYFHPLISDQWNVAKNSRVSSRLHVSTDAFQTGEAIAAFVGILFAAELAAAGAVGIVRFLADPGTTCSWFPGDGAIIRCEG
jgi:hypothetical protein